MPARTNPFQAAVAAVEHLLAQEGVTVRESTLLKEGGDGSNREVDILVEGSLNGHPISIAIECRDHAEKQDVTWVDELVGKYSALRVDTVVAVSRSGFTAGALDKADQHGIRVLTFKQLDDATWPAGVIKPGFRFLAMRHEFRGVRFGLRGVAPALEGKDITHASILSLSGQPATTVASFVQELVAGHAEAGIKETVDSRAPDLLKKGGAEEFDLTITLLGGGKAWPLPDGGHAEIIEVLLDFHVWLTVIEADTRHYAYNRSAVSIGSVPIDSASAIAVVAVQDPGKPGQMRVTFRKGDPTTLPG